MFELRVAAKAEVAAATATERGTKTEIAATAPGRLVTAVLLAATRPRCPQMARAYAVRVGRSPSRPVGDGVERETKTFRCGLPSPAFGPDGYRPHGNRAATYGPSGGVTDLFTAALIGPFELVANRHGVTALAATRVAGRGRARESGPVALVGYRRWDPSITN